jgi:PAS domain S-box-containing protein
LLNRTLSPITEWLDSLPVAVSWTLRVTAVAIAYYIAARVGLLLAFEKTNASPVWPPSGIAFAAVLLWGYRVWPGILVGALAANLLVFLKNVGGDLFTLSLVSGVIGAGNVLEAVCGRFLYYILIPSASPLDRAQDVFKFTFLAGIMCVVSPLIGPTALCLAGVVPWSLYVTTWFTWWLGDAAGVLVVTPFLLTWARQPELVLPSHRLFEVVLLFVLLTLATRIACGQWFLMRPLDYPLSFLLIPLLLWTTFRFGHRATVTAVVLVSGIAIWQTINGLGPFVRESVNKSLLLLQGFIGVITITTLAIVGAVTERRRAEGELKQARGDLERRVRERTAELARLNASLEAEITDRKRAEEAIRESERRYFDLFEGAPDPIITLDALGHVQTMNPAAEQISGYQTEEVVGKHFGMTGVLTSEALPIALKEFTLVLAGRERPAFELEMTRKDGARFSVEANPRLIRRENKVLGVQVIFRDITERKRAEEAERQRLERFAVQQSALLNLTRQVAFEAVEVGTLLRRITELDAKTLGVERVSVWSYTEDRSAIRCIDLYELSSRGHSSGLELVASKYPSYFEALARTDVIVADNAYKDPRTREFSDSYLTPLRISSMMDAPIHLRGVLYGVICHEHVGSPRCWTSDEQTFATAIANLISLLLEQEERKQTAEALTQKNVELARASAEREQLELFAFVASHDLQEPLQKIIAFGDLLREHSSRGLNTKGRNYVERMRNAALRMSELIESLLLFSRVTAKAEALQPVNLDRVLRDALADLELKIADSGAQIEVGPLPTILADRSQMQLLFKNLVSNAIKFRNKEEPPRIWIESHTLNERFTEITVRDNGIGFDEKYLDRVFKPFERLHAQSEYEGSGMGLAICQRIALRHGGQIAARSSPGKGTTFILTLPVGH